MSDFRVPERAAIHLKKQPTSCKPQYDSAEDYEEQLHANVKALSDNSRCYMHRSHALLPIIDAMDAAGKDGVISHTMSGSNPPGCLVMNDERSSAEERAHDFLWRTTRDLPARGKIGILNRSSYEKVLITRVHPELLSAEQVPDLENLRRQRFRYSVDFEAHMHRSGTRIVKFFFLHPTKDEQRMRFFGSH